MIGNAVSMEKAEDEITWIVTWDMLGFHDYQRLVMPWCVRHLEHSVSYAPFCVVEVGSEADALLLYLRFK